MLLISQDDASPQYLLLASGEVCTQLACKRFLVCTALCCAVQQQRQLRHWPKPPAAQPIQGACTSLAVRPHDSKSEQQQTWLLMQAARGSRADLWHWGPLTLGAMHLCGGDMARRLVFELRSRPAGSSPRSSGDGSKLRREASGSVGSGSERSGLSLKSFKRRRWTSYLLSTWTAWAYVLGSRSRCA